MAITTNTHSGARESDCGATFIELLVSVVLLGTAGVAVLVAMSTAAVGARINDEVVSAQRQLAVAGDALTDTDRLTDHYRGCDTFSEAQIVADYQLNVVDVALGSPNDVAVTDVRFWDGSTFGSSCAMSSGYRLQEVRLQSTVSGKLRELGVVVRPTGIPTENVVPAPTAPPVAGGGGGVTPVPTPGL